MILLLSQGIQPAGSSGVSHTVLSRWAAGIMGVVAGRVNSPEVTLGAMGLFGFRRGV